MVKSYGQLKLFPIYLLRNILREINYLSEMIKKLIYSHES